MIEIRTCPKAYPKHPILLAVVTSHKMDIMTEQNKNSESRLLQLIENRLVIKQIPHYFPGLEADIWRKNDQVLGGAFFDVIHPALNLIDVIMGQVKGGPLEAFVMAVIIKSTLLRFAQPILKGHQYSKTHLWEKNLLSPQEIINKLQEEVGEVLLDAGLTVNLFYGRFNLEYNTLSFVDCGSNRPVYYHANQRRMLFLAGGGPPLGTSPQYEAHISQMSVDAGDCLILYSSNLAKDDQEKSYLFNQDNLMTLIERYAELSASDILEQIKQEITASSIKEEQETFIATIKLTQDRTTSSLKHATAKFASDLAQLQAVRTFVQRVCQQAPINNEKLGLQLQLVINEIFCNVVKHSYKNRPKEEVVIESQLTDNGIYFTVSDKGESFNPTEIEHPNLSGRQEDGFGMFIIQQIADLISYTPKTPEDEWNHLRIFKRYFSEEDQMNFSHQIQDHILIIAPTGGTLDAKNAPVFKENVLNLIRSSGLIHLIFDLKQLQFIDSSGLGAFLAIQRNLNAQGGVLKLANLNKPIRTMFEIVSMHRIFDIFNSTEEAILSF